MENLLRWGIANTPANPDQQPRQPVDTSKFDSGIIDAILGRPDSELMKEDMGVAMDASKDEDERVDALDHLEMLVEQIDNANNMQKLGLWTPLHSLLTVSHSTARIKLQALWAIGTALQNNPAAQDAYMTLNPASTLFTFLSPSSPDSTPKLRSKVIYTLSGLLKHNAFAVRTLDDEGGLGWITFGDALQDPDITVRRKTVFLLNTLLISKGAPVSGDGGGGAVHTSQQQLHTEPPPDRPIAFPNSHAAAVSQPERAQTAPLAIAALAKYDIIDKVVHGLAQPVPLGPDGDEDGYDMDFAESCIR
ncbi:Fes1-domain-containing protein [Fistulina hepatica ATCC 64428]|uniref:Fes1-domain-containing protein n=1 Tax=Fistulina hepatica ATCC 64428 TaxID=1128425 RepID=A0A0D7A2C6_9AGAR|nr:Fes1-domain-containing protein [Fistulina hepatica ATCC 64428]